MNTQRILLTLVFITGMFTGTVSAEDQITLNFKEADIHTVIATVSESTGRNFIVDPRVKGRVTVVSAEPMNADALYETFLSILQVHGYAAVESGDITKILPEASAKQAGSSAAIVNDNEYRLPDDMVTKVVAIEHVTAAQLVPILRPLVPQYGHLAAYAPSNSLIISDRAGNVDRLASIIRKIDKSGDEELEIVQLQNANANDIAQVLSSLTGPGGNNKPNATNGKLSVIADPRTNSVLLSGEKSIRVKARAVISHLDTPLAQDADTQVIYLKYAQAKNLAPILQGYAKASKDQNSNNNNNRNNNSNSSSDVTILAEEETNSLVISAPPKTMRGLRAVIDRLDIRRAQVLVEAIIAEVSDSLSKSLGLEAAGLLDGVPIVSNLGPVLSGVASVVAANEVAKANSSSTDTDTAISSSALTSASSLLGGLQGGLAAGGIVNDSNGDFQFGAILRALHSDGDTNVLSTPSLLTLDNKEAKITVGSEIPFVTGSFTNTGGANGAVNPFQTIERRDVGISLIVTPHVVDDGTVQMEISLEASNPSTQTVEGAQDVVIGKRTVDTAVLADSGQVVILGGLMDDTVNESFSKTPILGDIPILGALFRSTTYTRRKTNLVVFLRPVVLKDGADIARYSQNRYNRLRQFQTNAAKEQGREDIGTFPLAPSLAEVKQDGFSADSKTPVVDLEAVTQEDDDKTNNSHRNSHSGPRGRR